MDDSESSAKHGDRNDLDNCSALRDELARQVVEQYSLRLKALVRRHLDQRIRRKEGTSDVVQSVFKSFFESQPDLADPKSLMGVLVVFTNRKIANVAKGYQAIIRDYRRERPPLSVEGDDSEFPRPELDQIAAGPSPEEVALAFEMLQSLNEREQRVTALLLENGTQTEVAKKLNCSERTVRRIIKTIKEKWRRLSDG